MNIQHVQRLVGYPGLETPVLYELSELEHLWKITAITHRLLLLSAYYTTAYSPFPNFLIEELFG